MVIELKKLNFLPSFIIATMEGKDFEAFAEQYPDLPASQVLKLWRVKQEKQEILVADIVDFNPLREIISAIRNDDLERFIELVKIQKINGTFDQDMVECEIARCGRIRLMEWCFSNQSKYLDELAKAHNSTSRDHAEENYRQNTWKVMMSDDNSPRYFSSAWFIAMQHEQYAFLRYLSNQLFSERWSDVEGANRTVDSYMFEIGTISIDMWLFLAGLVIIKDRSSSSLYEVFPSNSYKINHPMYNLIISLMTRYVRHMPVVSQYETILLLKQVIKYNIAKNNSYSYINNGSSNMTFDVEKLIVYVEQRATGNYIHRHVNELLIGVVQDDKPSAIEGE